MGVGSIVTSVVVFTVVVGRGLLMVMVVVVLVFMKNVRDHGLVNHSLFFGVSTQNNV